MEKGGASDLAQVSTHHRSLPDDVGRCSGRLRDGLSENAFLCALTEISREQPNKKILLVDSCATEQLAQQLHASARRAGAGDARDTIEDVVDIPKLERYL